MAGEAEAARRQEPLDGIALGDGRQRRAAADAARPASSRRAYELCRDSLHENARHRFAFVGKMPGRWMCQGDDADNLTLVGKRHAQNRSPEQLQ